MSGTQAAIYVRISDDREGAGLGVQRQEQDCRALCDQRGWTVAHVYVDNDISAYSGKPRPGYQQLLDDIAAGHVDVVVAWHTDRLHRSTRELEDFISLLDTRQVPVHTVRSGLLDLSTPAGRMTAKIVGAVAQHESEHKSDRQRRKALQLAEQGEVGNGGHRPFGYARDRKTLVPEEAEVLRRLYDQVIAGRSLTSLVRDLHDRGITTTTGRPWSQQGLRYNLLSPRNAALREHKRKIVGPAVWPPIVDRDTWEKAGAILAANTGRPYARKYLLTGFLVCGAPADTPSGVCGNRLHPVKTSQTQRFGCRKTVGGPGCGGILVRYEPAEDWVVAAFLRHLEQEGLAEVAPPPDDPSARLLASIAADEERLEQLAAVFADDPDANPLELRAAGARIRTRITETRSELARAAVIQRTADPTTVRQEWLSGAYDLEQQRTALGERIDRVEVGPARRGLNRFDGERLRIVWR